MVTENRSRTERGQLLLITAALIAVFLMSAVVLLNLLHESPEFGSERDAQSVEHAEQITAQMQTELRRALFMSATTDELERTPWAENGFEDDVDGFVEEYTTNAEWSRSGTTVASNVDRTEGIGIGLAEDEVVFNSSEDSDDLIDGVERLTYLHLEQIGTIEDTVNITLDNDEIRIKDETVTVVTDGTREHTFDYDGDFTLEVLGKTVQLEDEYSFEEKEIEGLFDQLGDGMLDIDGPIETGGQFLLATEGGSAPPDDDTETDSYDGDIEVKDDVIVDVTFDFEYYDSEIYLDTELNLWGES